MPNFEDPEKKREKKKKKKREKIQWNPRVLFGLAALFGAVGLFYILHYVIFDLPKNGWVVLGFIGAFIIGLGLYDAISEHTLKSKTTRVFLLLGAVLITLSEAWTYIAHLFDFVQVMYYFILLALCCGTSGFYLLFRFGVDSYLRKEMKIGRRRIKKLEKGVRNCIWYESLHRVFDLGALYHVNKIYTVLFFFTLLFTLFFGFVREASFVACALIILLLFISSAMGWYGRIRMNLDEYGKPFILLVMDSRRSIDSSLFDVMFLLFPCGISYVLISLAFEL